MTTYTLLNGKTLDLSELSPAEGAFLRDLRRMAENDISYFEIARTAIGPGSPALRGRQTIDRRTAATPLYLAAEDIAIHAGVQQGLILAPEFEHLRAEFPTDGSHISVAQAADFIGISRAAVYKAINAGTLQALKIGNVTVVNRQAAVVYRERREKSGFVSASDEIEDREHAGIQNARTLARGSKAKAARLLGLTARKASAAKTRQAGPTAKPRSERGTAE